MYPSFSPVISGISGSFRLLTQILSIHELVVDRVQYNSLGEATLYMGDIEVLLGGNADLNGKIGELNDMVPQLEGRKGTLHLAGISGSFRLVLSTTIPSLSKYM